MTRANKKKKSPQKEGKSFGRRVGENIRAAGELGREAVVRPEELPGRAHGALRGWFRKAWDVRGGGLYAVGVGADTEFEVVAAHVVAAVAQVGEV